MEKPTKFLLPSPFAGSQRPRLKSNPHFLTPSGMNLLPRERQPPPMYGPRGATVPGKYLKQMEKKRNVINQAQSQFCEACEVEFQSLHDMERHMAEHQRCQIDDCTYRGHPDVMDKHVAALHSSGLFEKCKRLTTPEEIAIWREDRKKRFPTLANVEMKKKAQEQRFKRGERLEGLKSRFGKREDRLKMQKGVRAQAGHENDSDQCKRSLQNKKRKRIIPQQSKVQAKTDHLRRDQELQRISKGEITMFGGTKQLVNYKHLKAKRIISDHNVLASLLGMYGSDEEDQSDESDLEETTFEMAEPKCKLIHDTTITSKAICTKDKVLQNSVSITETTPCSILIKNEDICSDDPPDEAPIAKFSIIPEISASSHRAIQLQKGLERKTVIKKSGLDFRKTRLRNQNTMLEKLLEAEIRHERNVLLQCIRFIRESNLF